MSAAVPARRRIPTVAIVLVVALAVMLVGVVPFRQILAQRRAVNTAETQLAALQDQNASLEAEAARLLTDIEVERRAREDFGFVRPGETSYIVLPPLDAEPGAALAGEPPDEGRRGLLGAVFDFLTGRDLDRDG